MQPPLPNKRTCRPVAQMPAAHATAIHGKVCQIPRLFICKIGLRWMKGGRTDLQAAAVGAGHDSCAEAGVSAVGIGGIDRILVAWSLCQVVAVVQHEVTVL